MFVVGDFVTGTGSARGAGVTPDGAAVVVDSLVAADDALDAALLWLDKVRTIPPFTHFVIHPLPNPHSPINGPQ
jgi:hypothetical protein